MKKLAVLIVLLAVVLSGCARPLTVDDVTYPTYGVFNEQTNKSKNVCYQVSGGNVFWAIILVETLIFPIYFVGWDLWEPVRKKTSPEDDCSFQG